MGITRITNDSLKPLSVYSNRIKNTVSIKDGLLTADCGLGIKYGLGIKRGLELMRTGYETRTRYKTRTCGLRTGYKIRTTDYFGKNGANWF